MILTLTLNPAVDQTVWVDRFVVGEVNRCRETQLDPAGKGINVSRMAHRLGWPTIAFGFLAGDTGHIVENALDEERVQHHFVHVGGQTRINVTIRDDAGRTATSLYGRGPAVDREHLALLEETLSFWLQAGRVLVLAGSLPPGAPSHTYATYLQLARARGVQTIVDADGEALRGALEASPGLIKPNVPEAERLLGRALPDVGAIAAGARELVRRGIGVVVISMGAAGAVCSSGDRAWRILPPQVPRESTVGSGDSLVAGLAVVLARGGDIIDGLRLGTAAGAATAMSPGTALGTGSEVETLLPQVRIELLP
jgi:1-phosphofructokinase family hexose kinase